MDDIPAINELPVVVIPYRGGIQFHRSRPAAHIVQGKIVAIAKRIGNETDEMKLPKGSKMREKEASHTL
jgi:hypothetical protein